MPRILFVYRRDASFISIDRDLLRERYELRDWPQPTARLNPIRLVLAIARSDLIFGWFAYWHTFLPITLAWLLRKPSVLVVGGFDTAKMPAIDYGIQGAGLRAWVSRWTMRRATRLITNSHYSRDELALNAGIDLERVTVVYHGVSDPFGPLPAGSRERSALTVAVVERRNLERKGLRVFVEAAQCLPDVEFVLAGGWQDRSVEQLRSRAPRNVTFTGWIDQNELEDRYRRASVYVQASLHEGFGMSVAEAMLAGCIPVTTGAGALPEVVGDTGVRVDDRSPEALAEAIERALAFPEEAREKARERVLKSFPLSARRDGLFAVIAEALD